MRKLLLISLATIGCRGILGIPHVTLGDAATQGGTDAGMKPDAPVTDAAITDAKITDALIADAPLTDAKVADARLTDARVPTPDAAPPDASRPDAVVPDAAPIDAGAPAATATGAAILVDVRLHDLPSFRGWIFNAPFQPTGRAPDYGTGSPFGCNAYLVNPSAGKPALTYLDEGTIQVDETGHARSFTCSAAADGTYACPAGSGSLMFTKTAVGPGDVYQTQIDPTALPNIHVGDSFNVGPGVSIVAYDPNAMTAYVEAPFDLSGFAAVGTQLVAAYLQPYVFDYTTGTTATTPDPFTTGDQVTFTLTSGGKMDFAGTSQTLTVPAEFVPDDTTTGPLTSTLPTATTTQDVTISCGSGCSGFSVLTFQTTDQASTGDSFVPGTQSVVGQCVAFGPNITIDKGVWDLFLQASAQKVQWTWANDSVAIASNPSGMPPNSIDFAVGHAIVYFTP